jgi:hypothetical protein
MSRRTFFPTLEAFPVLEAGAAAAGVLAAIRSGVSDEIEAELRIAAQVCGQPIDENTAEEERRELLGSVVDRLQQALAVGEPISSESPGLVGCVTLLEHLRVEIPRPHLTTGGGRQPRAIHAFPAGV